MILIKKIKNLKLKNIKKNQNKKKELNNLENKKVFFINQNLELVNDITKKHHQELIDEKIRQREKLYQVQAQKLMSTKNSEQERFEKQTQELKNKEA